MKGLSDQHRERIMFLLLNKVPFKKIVQEVGVSKTTVHRISRTIENFKPISKGGRPRILNERDKTVLVRKLRNGKLLSMPECVKYVKNTYDKEVSLTTMRRNAREWGFRAITRKKKPKLTLKQKRDRLNFAIAHRNWTVADWNKVIWSDETKINRFGSDGRKWAWKHPSNTLEEHHTYNTNSETRRRKSYGMELYHTQRSRFHREN